MGYSMQNIKEQEMPGLEIENLPEQVSLHKQEQEQKSFEELRQELNELYEKSAEIKTKIKNLTEECVNRFGVFNCGDEVYANSPFQDKRSKPYKIRIDKLKLNRTKDGLWFWTAIGKCIKRDGTIGILEKSFTTAQFK